MPSRAKKQAAELDLATKQYQQGHTALMEHPMFTPLLLHACVVRREDNLCPRDGWAVVTINGDIHVHPTRRATGDEWVYILAHCLLHLGFGHFEPERRTRPWNVVCDLVIAKFLHDLKLGRPPSEFVLPVELNAQSAERLYAEFCERGILPRYLTCGLAGPGADDMVWEAEREHWWGHKVNWQDTFAQGLAAAVASAVDVAAGRVAVLGGRQQRMTTAQAARSWFMSSYPLLGALAATFTIIEDAALCQRMSITVAAVSPDTKEIFMNPAAGLDEYECRFVMAHELLHVGLSHSPRRRGRDPFLWNCACDYIINGWLVEMGLGRLPRIGALYDPELKHESAESVYDRIVTDMRRFRKLATFRGVGLGDIFEERNPDWWRNSDGTDLDEFYRRCLSQGLVYCEGGRGFLPADLVEEIRALSQPPIPWDVELAQWFDDHFPPLELVRSYARQSRRQASTPDIPRPRWIPDQDSEDGRTFGVVLDTSGSMNRELLAKALGAIASYSMARDVPAVRVVFCDAATYDQGYMPPEAIADRVQVKGRGGTVLQPAIELLERAEDFPKTGPLLIITDGFCDALRIRRDHAFLLPEGRDLPFVPKGPVFRVK